MAKVNAGASTAILSAASPTPAITKFAEGTVKLANFKSSGSLEVILRFLIKSLPKVAFSFSSSGPEKDSLGRLGFGRLGFGRLGFGRLEEICPPNAGRAMFARPLGPSAILIGTTAVSGTFNTAKSCWIGAPNPPTSTSEIRFTPDFSCVFPDAVFNCEMPPILVSFDRLKLSIFRGV